MKILIACDKMKGTFSSKQFGEMVENAIKTITPNVETEILQVSDYKADISLYPRYRFRQALRHRLYQQQ